MEQDLQSIFQPQEVSPEIQQYLRIISSLKDRVGRTPRSRAEIEDDIWDALGDFA